ncbi:Uncharacterised protein [Brevundimonas diminuta]|nr:Uncharacterised protein [Brevundimonas diminuta]
MDIRVAFDTNGAAVEGVDHAALVADLQAELDKLAAEANVAPPKPDKQSPPEGAQGDAALIQWALDIATDPAMAKVYAQGLLLAINSILTAAKSKEAPAETEATQQKRAVTVSIFGKDIGLPVATAVIKTFLDHLQDS